MAKKMIKMDNVQNKNMDDAFKDFIKYCRVKNLSNATLDYYEDCFSKFREIYIGELEDITTDTVDDYVLHFKKYQLYNIKFYISIVII